MLSKKVLALVSWGSSTEVREVTDFTAHGLARLWSKYYWTTVKKGSWHLRIL